MRYANIREEYTPNHVYIVTTIPCPKVAGTEGHIEQEEIKIPAGEMFNYNQGGHIQDTLVSLTPGQRDRLLHGYCEPCYDHMFDDEEDEVEEDE